MSQGRYEQQNLGGRVNFSVYPAGIPIRVYVRDGIGAFVLACIGWALGQVFGVVLVLILFVWRFWYYAGWYRHVSTFTVDHKGIQLKTGLIDSSKIHRLLLKNTRSAKIVDSGYVFGGISAAAAVAVSNVGRNIEKKLESVSYTVVAEAGGVAHVIAGGLGETTAYGLMMDISKALQP